MQISLYKNFCALNKGFIFQSKNSVLMTSMHNLLDLTQLTLLNGGSFIDQTAVDLIMKEAIVYAYNERNNRKIILTETHNGLAESIQSLIKAAFVTEREIFELFGIFFKNAYDLRRLLTDYSLVGNPLKKIFPVVGFSEVRYSTYKTLNHQKISLAQDIREFEKKTFWY